MSPEERLSEIESFMKFVATEWPARRQDAALRPRCQRCILSNAAIALREGLCAECRAGAEGDGASPPDRAAGRTRLDATLAAHVGKGDEFDALLLFSGGKDSAYLAYLLKNRFPGLRILALMVDSGFASEVALRNARHLAAKLSLDFTVVQPRASLYEKAFRHALTHTGAGGSYASVDRIDGDLTFDIGRNYASRSGIPLVIAGLSGEQVERILGGRSFESPREQERLGRSHSGGFPLDKLFSEEELRLFWWSRRHVRDRKVPRVLFPFYAWEYDEQTIYEQLARLGLIEPGHDNPLVTNHDLVPVMLHTDVLRLGYCSFEPEFARLVRQGRASRDGWLALFQALEFLAPRGEFLPRCIAATLGRLGLTEPDLLPARREAA